MATMKKGSATNLVDAVTTATICVGDIVRDLDSGMECTIDRYGRAVDKFGGDHSKGRLRIVEKTHEKPEDFTPEEEAKEESKEEQPAHDEAPADKMNEDIECAVKRTIFEFPDDVLVAELERRGYRPQEALPDNALADELRRREYTVIAYKTVMVPTLVEL